jgi:uncharacterized membrane protein HdeD (DUF308 family)
LLIILGDIASLVTAYVLAGLMIVYAIWLLIKYIRSTTMEKIISFRLSGGLALLVTGVLLLFSPRYLEELLPFIWGLALLFGAFIKIQYAFGEKMLGIEKWWIMLIFAAFSLALGVISLSNPAFLGDSRSLIIGIMLIIEAIIDVVVFIMINNALKKNPPADSVLPKLSRKPSMPLFNQLWPPPPLPLPLRMPLPLPKNESLGDSYRLTHFLPYCLQTKVQGFGAPGEGACGSFSA